MPDLNGVAGLIMALAALASSQGIVAWVQRRQMRADVGDTGDSTIVDRLDAIDGRLGGIDGRLDGLETSFAEHLNGAGPTSEV